MNNPNPNQGNFGRKLGLFMIIAGIAFWVLPFLFNMIQTSKGGHSISGDSQNMIMGITNMVFYGTAGTILIFLGFMTLIFSGITSMVSGVFRSLENGFTNLRPLKKVNPKCSSCGGLNQPGVTVCKYCDQPLS